MLIQGNTVLEGKLTHFGGKTTILPYLAWHSHVVVLADADTLLLAAETLGRALARPATAA